MPDFFEECAKGYRFRQGQEHIGMRKDQIESSLRELGLQAGDVVLLHSALSSLGEVEGGADALVNAFLNVLGPEGTLVVPTFGDLGVVTKVVENRLEAISSIHPFASVAAIGGRAREICQDHWKAETAHVEETPYLRIADMGGYICLLGVDQDRNTTLHAVEAMLKLPYLKTTDERTFPTPEGEVTRSWPHFPGPHRDFIGLDRLLRERGIVKIGRIGSAVVRLMKSREMIDALLEVGGKDPAFALCDNPSCADCRGQRGDLKRDRFTGEDFTLVAAGSLAGRYVPEMVENCMAAGIDAVELDYLQGHPVQGMEVAQVKAAVEGLRAGGCTVTALRGRVVGDEIDSLLQTAAVCGIERVVLPLSSEASMHQKLAMGKGLSLSFYNTHQSSGKVFERMQQVANASLTFSGCEFARCGEHPFLTSLRNRLKRFVDQLDVEDCTWDGTPTPLARGNGEIAELVSILRCSGFRGYMVLGAGNRGVGDIAAAADRFAELLERI
jgi:aminoglycoside 3-N-acetyltransferase